MIGGGVCIYAITLHYIILHYVYIIYILLYILRHSTCTCTCAYMYTQIAVGFHHYSVRNNIFLTFFFVQPKALKLLGMEVGKF